MDFSEYFLNLFPKGIKKTIIYVAKFLAWLDVTAFFGGLVVAFIGWYFFNNEIMVALGLGSFVASIFAIIPFMMMYASAEYIDFKDQLRDLLEKEKKASESRFKLTPSDQAKLVKLKERQREIAALEAKRNRKHTGTFGCVVSILGFNDWLDRQLHRFISCHHVVLGYNFWSYRCCCYVYEKWLCR